jgi:hypothetical protein
VIVVFLPVHHNVVGFKHDPAVSERPRHRFAQPVFWKHFVVPNSAKGLEGRALISIEREDVACPNESEISATAEPPSNFCLPMGVIIGDLEHLHQRVPNLKSNRLA